MKRFKLLFIIAAIIVLGSMTAHGLYILEKKTGDMTIGGLLTCLPIIFLAIFVPEVVSAVLIAVRRLWGKLKSLFR